MTVITVDQLRRLAPRGRSDILSAIADGGAVLERYGITTPGRICHFLAQLAHESAGLSTTEEFASGKAYEERTDLGNTKAGDGVRYKGRGLIMLTGRANYRAYGKLLGIDLEAHPERAAEPALSLRIACEYWKAKGLNAYADRDDIVTITKRINGGTNGLSDRKSYLTKAKAIWGKSSVPAPVAVEDVRSLQSDLAVLGYDLAVDGISGPKTTAAVRAFQKSAGIAVDGIAGPATRDAIRTALLKRTASGEPPKEPSVVGIIKTPEGLAGGISVATAALGAASNPGPLQWALAIAVVAAVAVAGWYFIGRVRASA